MPTCVHSDTSQKMCMINLNNYVRNQMNTSVYDRISYYANKLGTQQEAKSKNASLLYYETGYAAPILPGYCTDRKLYYLREKATCNSNMNYSDSTLSLCKSFNSTGLDDAGMNTLYMLAKDLQCFDCNAMDGLFSSQSLKYYATFNMYAIACATKKKDCLQLPPTPQPRCYANQYKALNGDCQDCSDRFNDENCVYCNRTDCIVCRQNFFWIRKPNPPALPGAPTSIVNIGTCKYNTCGKGFCQNYDNLQCEAMPDSFATTCTRCSTNKGNTQCEICLPGYSLSADKLSCTKITLDKLEITIYVNATSGIHNSTPTPATPTPPGSPAAPTSTPQASTAKDTYTQSYTLLADAKIVGSSPDIPSPFLQHALRQIYLKENAANKVVATIYLGKGTHYFFTCTGLETEYFVKKTFTSLYNYCQNLKLERYVYNLNDNFEITILPLECRLKKDLLLAPNSLQDPATKAFDAQCVNLDTDDKPLVMVNNPYTYFNVTGKLVVENIRFSGVNQLARQTSTGIDIDLSVFPISYCKLPFEPSGVLDPEFDVDTISNTILQQYSKNVKNSTISLECTLNTSDYGFTVPVKPPGTGPRNDKCFKNKYQSILKRSQKTSPKMPTNLTSDDTETTFPPSSQSSLRCGGDIHDPNYFLTSTMEIYHKRRMTLFNLYSFDQYTTVRNDTPELILKNCVFEYFLADGYESLITIESQAISKFDEMDQTYKEGASGSNTTNDITYSFYLFNGADRGGKITIISSIFTSSRFCKGMIVYRPAHFEQTISNIRLSDIYNDITLTQSKSSHILIKDSIFTNLNFYSQVDSLALTGTNRVFQEFTDGVMEDKGFKMPNFVNVGIVLNVEDFGGRIEIVGSKFERNMHYIPGIQYTPQSKGDLSIEMFRDQFSTMELHLTVCNDLQEAYLFGRSQLLSQMNPTLDLDSLFESYERLSVIYISRNKDLVLIKDSTFRSNIGTHGGAITINSPDWASGDQQPHVVLRKNVFEKNMAYFSGNAVYIRNTMVKGPNQEKLNSTWGCAGVNLIENSFINNIGMKVHNGGAVSAYCHIIDLLTHVDYASASNINVKKDQQSSTVIKNETAITVSSWLDGQVIAILRATFNVQGNYFEENYSGGKGTALYVRGMTSVRLIGNTFVGNAPVYALAEVFHSPYYMYFSQRSMSYFDDNCVDEFMFLQDCNMQTSVTQFGGVQWSIVQGAVYIQFCEEDYCIEARQTQELLLQQNVFTKNSAGPIVDLSQQVTASQLFIRGGLSVQIYDTTFSANSGDKNHFSSIDMSKMIKYFPVGYFESSMSPAINIQMNPPPRVGRSNTFNFAFSRCKFIGNRNMQVVGLSTNNLYYGSIIQIENVATAEPMFPQLVSLNVSDSEFRENIFTGSESSQIYAYMVHTQVQRSQFINNGRITSDIIFREKPSNTSSSGSIYGASSVFPFKSYSFKNLQQYGCIMLEGDTAIARPHEFVNNTFSYNFASQGVAYTLVKMDEQEVYCAGNTYTQMYAEMDGSILYWEENRKKATLLMERETATFLFSNEFGAIRIRPLLKGFANFILRNSSFTNVHAKQGQAVSLYEVGKVLIHTVNFNRSRLQIGPEMSAQALKTFKKLNLPMLENFIATDMFRGMTENMTQEQGYIYIESVKVTDNQKLWSNITFRGTMVLANVRDPYYKYSEIVNCNFTNNVVGQQSVLYSYNSRIRMANLLQIGAKSNPFVIANNSNQDKGSIGLEGNTEFVGENLQLFSNHAEQKGSTFYLSASQARLSNSAFTNNSATHAATIIIESDSLFDCFSCTFQGNYADDSSVLFAQNNEGTSSLFRDSRFIKNTAGTNLINLLYSNVSFTNCIFQDNLAQAVNHGITLISSESYIVNATINYTTADNEGQSEADSGFFNLNYRSYLELNSSRILNTRGAMAGVMYVTGQSEVRIGAGTQINNSKSLEGKVINAVLASQLIINNVTFFNNTQIDVYLEQTPASITNSRFLNSAQNSIYVTSATLVLTNSLFEDLRHSSQLLGSPESLSSAQFTSSQGHGVFCRCKDNSIIANNTFRHLSAQQGGAIYLLAAQRSRSQAFSIAGNRFDSCQALEGGAIYLEDAVYLTLRGGNSFTNNLAMEGGAIYLSCSSQTDPNQSDDYAVGVPDFQVSSNGKWNDDKKCRVRIRESTRFQGNRATDGGALKWTKERPQIDMKTTVFQSNTAQYGKDIGSYPSKMKLEFLTNGDDVNKYNKSAAEIPKAGLRMLQISGDEEDIGYVPPLVSGNKMAFNLYIIDQDGLLYTSDSQSKAVLDKDNAASDIIVLNNEAIAKNGIYHFNNVEIRAKPGTNPSLKLDIQGLQTFGNELSFTKAPLNITTSIRKCVAGEELTVDNRCVACPPGFYQYFDPEKVTPCKQCPKDANCSSGKAMVYPKPGYWRSSNISENFIKCPNQAVCLGGDVTNALGKCDEGYGGIVCGDCDLDYSKSKQFECKKCPDRNRNIIQTVFILLGSVFYVAFLVRQTLASADQQKSVSSVYMKIMTNHFQILGAISNIDYQWPKEIEQFQEQQNQVSQVSQHVFSFDCFLMGEGSIASGVPVFFQKLVLYGVLPFIMVLACLLFWAIVGKIQKKTLAEFRGKFISTLIVVLFLIHPDIAKSMFLTFNCLEIDGVFRMKESVRSVCYKGEHLLFISVVAFPAIGLWVFGIPLFAFLVLYKNKRVLQLMMKPEITQQEKDEIVQLKMKYGFLFSGYDARTYFWEVIIMYRKILIIATSVFLSTVSSESQVLVVIFIIVINMFLQIRFSPFYTSTLNKMENYSLQVAAVTIYTGMYYVTGRHYTYMSNQAVSWFFLACIVLPNLIFIAYWLYHMRLEVLKELYKKNVQPCLFATVAWTGRDAFYEKYMREEEVAMAKGEQRIVDVIDDKASGTKDELSLDQIKLEMVDKTKDDALTNLNDQTMEDLINQPATWRSRKKESSALKYEENGMPSSRSFKVFPESSLPATARHMQDKSREEFDEPSKQQLTFNTPRQNGPLDVDENGPSVGVPPFGAFNNRELVANLDKGISRRARRFASTYNAAEDVDNLQPQAQTLKTRVPKLNLRRRSPERSPEDGVQEDGTVIEEIQIDEIHLEEEDDGAKHSPRPKVQKHHHKHRVEGSEPKTSQHKKSRERSQKKTGTSPSPQRDERRIKKVGGANNPQKKERPGHK